MNRTRVSTALAAGLCALSCGEFDTPVNPVESSGNGGRTTGAGGTDAAGGSGAAGAGSGGDTSVDAGVDSGEPTESQGGGSSLPEGCPTPAPEPVAAQTIAIQSINFDTSEIVLRNVAGTPQTIALGRQGWQWCAYPRYWSLTDDVQMLELAPGDTYTFIAVNNTSGPLVLYAEEGEMAMYPRTGVFEEYEEMQAFAAWGDTQAFRESYAVQKGLWVFGERIEIEAGHTGFVATGPTNRGSGYTSVPAECLQAPAPSETPD